MNTKQRWLVIAAFGLAVAMLAEWAPAPEDDVVPVSKDNKRSMMKVKKTPSHDEAQLDLQALHTRHKVDLEKEDLFQSQSWYIPPPPPKPKPPPPPPPPPPPAPPQAPPMPYAFMGSYQEPGGKIAVYLTRADKLYTVSVGDTLEGTYKIESIKSGQLTMIYLPLNISQNLRTGDH